ncbi:hypothetical protein Pint_31771 [Pistacia integerrima]|uniref:Uncharacterized protein n=1 Tax=Pistacia integerrima TaxID=434235 RepID=A0ACC0XQ81_9ROSI|nr:hypothetical protein Pint_31771 [Pistacia integerrima]
MARFDKLQENGKESADVSSTPDGSEKTSIMCEIGSSLLIPVQRPEIIPKCCRFTWVDSDPKLIANPQMVKLHLVDTKIHKVDTLVSYKNE